MMNKLPVLLAIAASAQWAPLAAAEIQAEDASVSSKTARQTKAITDHLQDQEDPQDVFAASLDADQKYLNQDENLLVDPSVPSATKAEGNKREAVYVLAEEDGYAEISDQGTTGWVKADALSDSLSEIFDDTEKAMYISQNNVSVYTHPNEKSSVLTVLSENDAVTLTGTSTGSLFRIQVNGQTGYVDHNVLSDHRLTFSDRLAEIQAQPVSYSWSGAILNPASGSVSGPSGRETYYNLNMSTVVSVMRSLGFDEADYPYWVRADGARMLGPYVMTAADLNVHPKGSVIAISLGQALVCDTGAFVSNGSGTAVDVAVTW